MVYIGTLAPARGGWWHDLVSDGSLGSTFVHALQGDAAKWDQWPEIRRCNPLTAVSAAFRAKLLEERDKARSDGRLKARFLSYRLNVPSGDESTVLLTRDDWERVCSRAVGVRDGRPVVGVDLGGGRAWSAAVALWRSGHVEAVAVAPGVPSLAEQERRDRVPSGTYQRLAAAGVLATDGDRRVPRVETLMDRALAWRPESVTCDRFRLADMQDAVGGRVRIVPRICRWSEAAEDIRALRRYALDGPLSVAAGSRDLIAASLAVATVKTDDQGSVRLVKRGTNNHVSRRRRGGADAGQQARCRGCPRRGRCAGPSSGRPNGPQSISAGRPASRMAASAQTYFAPRRIQMPVMRPTWPA